jgi:hypothetical protein
MLPISALNFGIRNAVGTLVGKHHEELMEWVAEWLLKSFDFAFGCHHRNLSRVFTIEGRTYRVCCGCGVNFKYSLENMSMERHARRIRCPTVAPAGRMTAERN